MSRDCETKNGVPVFKHYICWSILLWRYGLTILKLLYICTGIKQMKWRDGSYQEPGFSLLKWEVGYKQGEKTRMSPMLMH